MAARAVSSSYKLIDIGSNLTDPMYQGFYHGKSYHPPDLESVLQRSYEAGLDKIIVTGGSLSDCYQALELVQKDDRLYTTVGVHPTRCEEFESTGGGSPQTLLDNLLSLAEANRDKVVAIGECGLDYDRIRFCEKSKQLKYFEQQLLLSDNTRLPLFLHCRNAFKDFFDVLKRNKSRIHAGGVVHSFDGSLEEMMGFVEFGLYIGVNGCSLKTAENLEVVKRIPLDRLLLETDAPWCEIRPSHAGYQSISTLFPGAKKKERWEPGISVKNRNEPRNIVQVLEVVAAVTGKEKTALAGQIYANTCNLFKFVN